jgi:hypothetical protein
MKNTFVALTLLCLFTSSNSIAQSAYSVSSQLGYEVLTPSEVTALEAKIEYGIVSLMPGGCFDIIPAPNPYSKTCGISSYSDDCPPPACDSCMDIQLKWKGDCDVTRLVFTFEGCFRICGEVVNPALDDWNNDRSNCALGSVELTSANPPSSNLKPNQWFRIRICGSSLSGKALHVQAYDCLSMCPDTYMIP